IDKLGVVWKLELLQCDENLLHIRTGQRIEIDHGGSSGSGGDAKPNVARAGDQASRANGCCSPDGAQRNPGRESAPDFIRATHRYAASRWEISITRARLASFSTSALAAARFFGSGFASHSSSR